MKIPVRKSLYGVLIIGLISTVLIFIATFNVFKIVIEEQLDSHMQEYINIVKEDLLDYGNLEGIGTTKISQNILETTPPPYIEEVTLIKKDENRLLGNKKFRLDKEQQILEEIQQTKPHLRETIIKDFELNGTPMKKTFVPLEDGRIVVFTFDLSMIDNLNKWICIILTVVLFIEIFMAYATFRFINKKYLKELTLEKERLKTAEEFKDMMNLLPEMIFKIEKNLSHKNIVTYSEGNIPKATGRETKNVFGKELKEILSKEVYSHVSSKVLEAFEGNETKFEWTYKNKIYSALIKPTKRNEETTKVIEVAGYCIDITEKKETERKIEFLAYYDHLTDLPNRFHFQTRLEEFSYSCQNKFAVLFFDLDGFKHVNDKKGHATGDELLRSVSMRLQSDLKNGEFLARMGGDEFTMLIPVIDEKEVLKRAEEIVGYFSKPFTINDEHLSITTSIGISIYPKDSTSTDQLLKKADIAMYQAKSLGKNMFRMYCDEEYKEEESKNRLVEDLKKSIDNKELELHYQPQVDSETGKLIGVESLLRWKHPVQGYIPPAKFIPLAEENGFIEKIAEWTLYQACRQHNKWKETNLGPVKVSVNLSARQFRQDNLLSIIKKVLKETGIEPQYLSLEITESTSMENVEYTIQTLNEIRKLDIQVSIDDFGTGYSSLNYLKNLPIDTLKIDKSFVQDLEGNSNGKLVVQSIIALAKALNLEIIAEGVETLNQIEELKTLEVYLIQGYYFSKPVPSEQVQSFYQFK